MPSTFFFEAVLDVTGMALCNTSYFYEFMPEFLRDLCPSLLSKRLDTIYGDQLRIVIKTELGYAIILFICYMHFLPDLPCLEAV